MFNEIAIAKKIGFDQMRSLANDTKVPAILWNIKNVDERISAVFIISNAENLNFIFLSAYLKSAILIKIIKREKVRPRVKPKNDNNTGIKGKLRSILNNKYILCDLEGSSLIFISL